VISQQDRSAIDGAVLGPHALVLRWFAGSDDDRLLTVNLGTDLRYVPAPEPLLAPVPARPWILQWSSDHPDYGGPGVVNPLTEKGWHIPATSATLFAPSKT
jgi:maltooligosyltrehalose trehalohydrolase